jgi:hypothetical protein
MAAVELGELNKGDFKSDGGRQARIYHRFYLLC